MYYMNYCYYLHLHTCAVTSRDEQIIKGWRSDKALQANMSPSDVRNQNKIKVSYFVNK